MSRMSAAPRERASLGTQYLLWEYIFQATLHQCIQGALPEIPPSIAEPPTCHFAMYPLLTSQISTAFPISVLPFRGATSDFSESSSMRVPESLTSNIEPMPNSAFEAT